MTDVDSARLVIANAAEWVRLGLETAGAITIAAGAIASVGQMAMQSARREPVSFTSARSALSRFLVLALEFQLAADILETSVAPKWAQIGQLAAIAAIRTALNYFLSREIAEEQQRLSHAAT
jgi:uncharacterized membrane protein